jgi:hypothetical protein
MHIAVAPLLIQGISALVHAGAKAISTAASGGSGVQSAVNVFQGVIPTVQSLSRTEELLSHLYDANQETQLPILKSFNEAKFTRIEPMSLKDLHREYFNNQAALLSLIERHETIQNTIQNKEAPSDTLVATQQAIDRIWRRNQAIVKNCEIRMEECK